MVAGVRVGVEIRTTFVQGQVTIHVSHRQGLPFEEAPDMDGALLLRPAESTAMCHSDDRQPDVLTRVEIDAPGLSRRIFVAWSCTPWPRNFGVPVSFEVLLIEETGTLFLGAASAVAAVGLSEMRPISQHHTREFWGFERKEGYVLELGELACFLYDLHGNVLGHAAVDPPYRTYETKEGIRFESGVAGARWLRYPGTVRDPDLEGSW